MWPMNVTCCTVKSTMNFTISEYSFKIHVFQCNDYKGELTEAEGTNVNIKKGELTFYHPAKYQTRNEVVYECNGVVTRQFLLCERNRRGQLKHF